MKQKKGLKRNTIDKFYTSDKTVKECMKHIGEHININKDDDLCIEPSAGNGSFINCIKTMFTNYQFYDIEPENDEIIKQDYLTLDFHTLNKWKKIHAVGNPPFGRQSSLAIKFIKRTCKYCDSVSFILPKSFKKNSMKKHFPLNFHLIKELDLDRDSFLVNKKTYDVPCLFQIWIKKSENRSVPKKLIPKNFKFVKINETPHISFRRVGVYASKIDIIYEGKSPQSHYFIKFNEKPSNDLIRKLNAIEFDCSNYTVGPKSISKQELIKEFNQILT